MNRADLDEFTRAYIEAMIWCGVDKNGDLEATDYEVEDVATEELEKIVADCQKFQTENAADIAGHESQAGHDFWLTRNHHGAGFWDRPEVYGKDKEAGERLTKAALAYGELHPYDHFGQIYAE